LFNNERKSASDEVNVVLSLVVRSWNKAIIGLKNSVIIRDRHDLLGFTDHRISNNIEQGGKYWVTFCHPYPQLDLP
jgi:hypothetical protein